MHSQATSSFGDDLARVEVQLRGALAELAASARADPSKPQQLARDLRLNRGLAWKMARIVEGRDRADFIDHMPGAAGVDILLETMRRGGASAEATERARAAFAEFDRITALHAGDRQTLAVMASHLNGRPLDGERMVEQRRLAYQGNSGILGIRARVVCSLNIVAPNAQDPAWVDIVRCGGFVDLHRVRGDAHWLLFRQFSLHDDGSATEATNQPLDPECAARMGVPLIEEFCSKPLPPIERVVEGRDTFLELPPGPVGNTACITCFQGSITRRIAPAHRTARDTRAEFASALRTPAEDLLFDLFLHKSMAASMRPELGIFTTLDGRNQRAGADRERQRLPIAEAVQPIGTGLAGAATDLHGDYQAMVARVFERSGWDPMDFEGFRFEMAFPPIPAMAIMAAALPEAPSGSGGRG